MNWNKKLTAAMTAIAIAAPGAAYAQSQSSDNVRLYGVLDAFYGSMRYSGGPDRRSGFNDFGLTTSYWGVAGQESLGSGLNVEFALESFIRLANGAVGRFDGDSWYGRNAYIGMNGSFGSIKAGRNTTPWFVSMLLFNPQADSQNFSPIFMHSYIPVGSPVNYSLAGDTEWNSSVLYQSPNFGGAQLSLIYGGDEGAGQSKRNYGGNLTYFNGDFGATLAMQRVADQSTVEFTIPGRSFGASSQTSWLAGVSYDFKMVKLFGEYAQSVNHYSFQSSQRNHTVQLGASAPIGPGSLMVSWARTTQGGNPSVDSSRRDTASVVYDYVMSKRTDIYAAWLYDKTRSWSSASSFGLGLRHRF